MVAFDNQYFNYKVLYCLLIKAI